MITNHDKNNNIKRQTMTDKNKITNDAIKLYAEFVDEFGQVPDRELLIALIQNFVDALDFINYHGLYHDFEVWADNPETYRLIQKSRMIRDTTKTEN
jgi:hypothetical protein